MLFTRLKLNNFGRFHNKELELKPGINLIYGENEAGKSTLHTFIKGMLFGIERLRGRGSASKEDLYTRYLPWDYPGAFGGSMDIEIDGKQYRLLRSFHANDKSFTVTDLSTGREVKLKEGLISEMIPGLTESAFKNTVSIEQQKAQTDSELAAQVRNYIANLSVAKSKEVDVVKAVSLLNDQRKQLEPVQNTAVLKALQVEIEAGLAKEETMDRLSLQLKELLADEKQLREQKDAAEKSFSSEETDRMEQLPAMTEKFHSYQEMSKQLDSLEAQGKDLLVKIKETEKEQQNVTALKEDIREAEQMKSQQSEQEQQELKLIRELTACRNLKVRNAFLSFLPTIIPAALIMMLTGFVPIGVAIAAVLIISGIAVYVILGKNSRKRLRDLQVQETELTRRKLQAKSGLEHILQKYRVSSEEALKEKQEEALKSFYFLEHIKHQLQGLEQRKKELEDSRDVLYETIMKYMQYFNREDELTALSMQKLQETIRKRKLETSDQLAQLNSCYENCKLRMEKLRWELQTLEGNEEQLIKNQEQYHEIERKQKENALELEAIGLAVSAIQELSAEIHDSFGQQLNQAVSEVISKVTGQKYCNLKVDEKLEVKVECEGDLIALDKLSAGTIDQVYFALRLVVADLLLGKEEIPLLLDDSFALYDEGRVKAALTRVAEKKQILLFTCHKREQKLLEELGLPYHLVNLSGN